MSRSLVANAVAAQLRSDRQATRKRPELLQRKWSRMAASPFAFFRGAVPLFDALVGRTLPGSSGVLVGDAHLENFGAFATARGAAFHVNDFDEHRVGQLAVDVLRLCTSVLLSRPELKVDGVTALGLSEAAFDGHQVGISGAAPVLPGHLRSLAAGITEKRQDEWLKKRLERPGRLLRDGDRLRLAPSKLALAVPAAMQAYLQTVEVAERPASLEVLDVVRRVAGTGSLGVERLLVLAKCGERERLFELKQMRQGGEAVVALQRRALPSPPSMLGFTRAGAVQFLVRRFAPGEDKLAADELPGDQLGGIVTCLGGLLGQVHLRANGKVKRFSKRERAALLDRARELAGLHEEAFLHFCAATRHPASTQHSS